MSKTNAGSISRIYMKCLQVSKKKKAVHIGQSAKAMNKQFPKKKNQKAHKHIVRYSN